MIFNIVIFVCVIVVLIRHTRDTAARMKKPVSHKTIIRLMISVGGVMFLFGLTWLFGILTFSVDGLREAFQILFTIFNSFQGFFIFLFFCVLNKEALESWKELLSCGKYKSKLLHPSKAKYNSNVMANKVNQSKTGTTALLALSSREKYASGSSIFDRDSRSATPERENAYEQAPPESTKVNLGTIENPVIEENRLTQDTPELTRHSTVPAIIVEQVDSVNDDLQSEGAGSSGEKGKKKKKALSLKARIKRYTTKKISKHEEEVEVHFNSSQVSGGEEDTTTQL